MLALMLLPLLVLGASFGFRGLGKWNRRIPARAILLAEVAVFGLYVMRFQTGRGDVAGMADTNGALGMFACVAVLVLPVAGWLSGAAERRAG